MKRYMNTALLYAVLAMAGGVFYREFTKFNGFAGKTTLGVVHTHYFLLGMVFFLLLLVLEKNFSFTAASTARVLAVYHVGLNLTAVMFVVRGITQVLGTPLSSGASAPSPASPGSATSCWVSAWCFCSCRSAAASRIEKSKYAVSDRLAARLCCGPAVWFECLPDVRKSCSICPESRTIHTDFDLSTDFSKKYPSSRLFCAMIFTYVTYGRGRDDVLCPAEE